MERKKIKTKLMGGFFTEEEYSKIKKFAEAERFSVGPMFRKFILERIESEEELK